MYKIESKKDFQSGVTLVIKFPEDDLDINSLYTILKNSPDFILPFHHKIVDGIVEITYKVGNMNKLTYLSCERNTSEYIDLWTSILQPLFDCDDWFMSPYSFVLDLEHIYCDKNNNKIFYIYIPTKKDFSSFDDLKNLAINIAKQNHVEDITLENKVVWALQDFNPKDFLKMIKTYDMRKSQADSIISTVKTDKVIYSTENYNTESENKLNFEAKLKSEKIISDAKNIVIPEKKIDMSELSIDFSMDSDDIKDKKKKSSFLSFNKDKNKKEKETIEEKPKKNKEKRKLWGKKESKEREIIEGAALMQKIVEPEYFAPIQEIEMENDITQLDFDEELGCKLRYIGSDNHPRVIVIDINENEVYTIGRYDASIGKKQSSFEFEKKTKAISRKHAAIERKSDGYYLIDLSSSAGTYVNGKKLQPNSPIKLNIDYRISFGHSGADYLWEG